jgi:hypothetical protein
MSSYKIKDPIELLMREGFEDWESSNELNTQMGDTKEGYKGRMVSERCRYGYGDWFDWQTNKRWQLFQKAFLSGAEWAQNSNALENSNPGGKPSGS